MLRLEILICPLCSGRTTYARSRARPVATSPIVSPHDAMRSEKKRMQPRKKYIDPSDIPHDQRPAGMLSLPTPPIRREISSGALIVNRDDIIACLNPIGNHSDHLSHTRHIIESNCVDAVLMAGSDVIVDQNHLTLSSRYRWVEHCIKLRRAIDLSLVAVLFPLENANIYARRRFDRDPESKRFNDLLDEARYQIEQWESEPFSLSEGFDEVVHVERF